MNDDTIMKNAMESVKTQKKMRDQFIKDFMKTTTIKNLGEEAASALEHILLAAYNKGAVDALSILIANQLTTMEGGENYDI